MPILNEVRLMTDVKIFRLQQIANVFEMDLLELFSFGEKNVVYFCGEGSSGNGDHSSSSNSGHSCNINNYFSGREKELEHELEKSQLKMEQAEKESIKMYCNELE